MTAMKDMFKDILQKVMECEFADELGYEKSDRMSSDECANKSKNYRNGYSKKTVKTQMGEKILSLYACGMSQRDIAEQIKNLYDVEISPELVSKIIEKIMPDVTAWQNRPLEAVYPFVFMDAIHYKVKENHQYITKAAYVVLGINLDGQKDILGIRIGENESSKFWLNVLNKLKTRGIKDVFLFCVDGLTGFRQAIEAAFPNAQIQHCIIHQIRSSTRFVSYKHIKELMTDLKKVYQAISEEEAMNNLILFKDKWGKASCISATLF